MPRVLAIVAVSLLGLLLTGAADAASGKAQRRGGKVTKAWPARGASRASKPDTRLTRWLAQAGGPLSADARARAAAAPLRLVLSYEIPTDDPAYERLSNWSWTYDSGIVGAAF